MIVLAKNYLSELFLRAGIKKEKIITDNSYEPKFKTYPWVSLISGEEKLEEDRRKVASEKLSDRIIIRHKKQTRKIVIEVTISGKTEEEVSIYLDYLLENLEKGIMDKNNNYVAVMPEKAVWSDSEKYLKDETWVTIFINFVGGVYQDKEIILLPKITTKIKGANDE